METDLSAVLEGDNTPIENEAVEPQGEIQQPETPSGEEQQSTPSEPNEVHGLRAAVAAERRKRQELEQRELDYQRQLQEFQQRQTQQQQPQQQKRDPNSKPLPDEFQTYEDYLEALTDFKAEQRDKARTEREQQQAQQRRAFEVQSQYLERANKFKAQAPDYDMVTGNPYLPINEAMKAIITESENGPAIAYYLGKNPQEAARISQMQSLVQVAHAMFSIGANHVNKVEEAIQQEIQPQKLPGSLSNERAAGSNGKQPFIEPSLDDILKR